MKSILPSIPTSSDSSLPINCRYEQQKFSTKRVKVYNASKPTKTPQQIEMFTKTILIAAISALAAASPINVAGPDSTGVAPPFPTGSSSPPAGYGPPPGVPYPTAVPVPRPGGDKSDCPIDGQLVCNGPSQWGLCNWGKVQFQPVAAGTQCLDGEIVFAQGFGTNA